MYRNPRSDDLAGDFFTPSSHQAEPDALQDELMSAHQTLQTLFETELGNTALHAAIEHHLQAGGQRLRLKMALSAGCALGLDKAHRQALALSCELIHNASLIHDDVQDQDLTRRGQASLWSQWGSDVAICAGDYLLSAAYRQAALCSLNTGSIIGHIHARITELIRGQSLDLELSKDKDHTWSFETYKDIALGKSGTLLALPIELPLIAAGQTHALSDATAAGGAFAIAYQISDDLADLEHDIRNQCLNVIHALISQGQTNAVDLAITEARLQLDKAQQYAQRIPNNAAWLLIDRATTMAAQLKSFGAQANS